MYIHCEGFTCPKDGASDAQNDDAYNPRNNGPHGLTESNAHLFRCAIADGATESLFAGGWAARLTRAFERGRLDPNRRECHLARIQKSWTRFLRAQQLPWYAEAKAESGSFATLLGLELHHSQSSSSEGTARWTATALGDSCLFLVRNHLLETAFPLTKADEFDNQPYLVASNEKLNKRFKEWLKTEEGELRNGDIFYLMTDALSFWFLREFEAGNRPWATLSDIGTNDGEVPRFAEWISSLRAEDDRMNDDATLLRIEINGLE